MHISELRPREAVCLDGDRLEDICHRLGHRGGEAAIYSAMEDLAALMHTAGTQWRGGELLGLEKTARRIAAMADPIGMLALAQIAAQVTDLAGSAGRGRLRDLQNATALAAMVARMPRVGVQSLLAVWEQHDLMI